MASTGGSQYSGPSDWVNLQDYLNLNSDQAAGMGSDVYNTAENAAVAANNQLGSDATGFQNAAASGTVQGPSNPEDLGQTNWGSAAINANQKYGGPTDINSYDPTLATNVQNASDTLQSAGGTDKSTAIGETYGAKGSTGAAGGAFDSFLTGAGAYGSQLAALAPSYQNLTNTLGVDASNAQTQAAQGMLTSQNDAQAWGNYANGQVAETAIDQYMKTNAANLSNYINNGTPGSYMSKQAPGSVLGIGTQQSFLQDLQDGATKLSGPQSGQVGGVTGSPSQLASDTEKALGITSQQFTTMIKGMNQQDWQNFWTLGVIPNGTPGVDPSKTMKVGGWTAPYLSTVNDLNTNGYGLGNQAASMGTTGAGYLLKMLSFA